MKKHADSIDAAILDRIQSGAPGDVFAPTDFLDLGSRAAVDQALSRNCRAGLIRKASRGLYDVPHNHPLIGLLSSSPDAVIKAITRRDGIVLQPAGGRCANDLGIAYCHAEDFSKNCNSLVSDRGTLRFNIGDDVASHVAPKQLYFAGEHVLCPTGSMPQFDHILSNDICIFEHTFQKIRVTKNLF